MPDMDHKRQSGEVPIAPLAGSNQYAALGEIADLVQRQHDPSALYVAAIAVLERALGELLALIVVPGGDADGWRRESPQRVPAELRDVYPQRLPMPAAMQPFWRGEVLLALGVDQLHDTASLAQAYRRHAIVATALIPIPVAGEAHAALLLRADTADFFTDDLLIFLRRFAASLGAGVEMHEQRQLLLKSVRERADQQRAMHLLGAMTDVAARAPSEAVLLAETCRVARSIGGYKVAWIGLLDATTRELRAVAQAGLIDGLIPEPGWVIGDAAHAADVAVRAVASGQTQLQRVTSGDSADGLLLQLHGEGVRALLAQPLSIAHAVAGVLVLGSVEPAGFSALELQSMAELAGELELGLRERRACAARAVAEQALALHVQQLRAMLSTPHAGVLVLSAQQTVSFVNTAFCALFGLTTAPEELVNQSAATLRARLVPTYAQPEREWQRMQEILAAGAAVTGDEICARDGRVFLRDFTPIVIDGVTQGSLWQLRDISAQKQREQRVEQLAFFDEASGLPNRRRLFEVLEVAHATALAQQSMLAVGVLDLDRFKNVNDTLGRDGGDRVLTETAARILGMLRPDDVLARFGGDEFALVIFGLDSKEQLDAISRVILQALRAPFDVAGGPVQLSASVGWTMFPRDRADAEGLVRHAELALYAAKGEGRDCGLLYEPTMEAERVRLRGMRERVAHALQTSRLQLLFQPVVYIDGLPGRNGVAGMEALLRLDDAGPELVEPAKFMHVLDDPQLARPIGRYVLNEALKQCQSWIRVGVSIPVAVNISTRHLLHPAFFSDIDLVLETYPDVVNVGFGIEVTETGPSMDEVRAKEVIEECRRRGIRVSLDDFGTGSASLSHLQNLDIEHIKLDQSFVRDILSDERNMAIAAGVITTARMLAKTVIAEGVETAEQGDLLASLGCHQLQGFSIARPMPSAAVPGWVMRWNPPASWAHLVEERRTLLASQVEDAHGPASLGR